jgi:hypothetical protein
VDARPVTYLDLKLVCRRTRSIGTDSDLGSTSGEATNLQVGPTLRCPARLSNFCMIVEAIAFISLSLVVQGPEKTFTEKRVAHSGPCEALLEVWERLPPSCRTSMAGSLGGAGAVDPGASTINVKKHRRWAPSWMLNEICQHPPST